MAGETPWTAGSNYGLLRTEVMEGSFAIASVVTRRFYTGEDGRSDHVERDPDGERRLRIILAAPEMADIIQRSIWALDAFRRGDTDGYPDFDKWEVDCRTLLSKIGDAS
jgi:hypothetical protein